MTSETKLIIGGRQSGRTLELIKHSAKTGNTFGGVGNADTGIEQIK